MSDHLPPPAETMPSEQGIVQRIAVVSGKGGSGKTLVATALMLAFAENGTKTLLVDGDLGTGGLTYYVGFHNIANISGGLTELILKTAPPSSTEIISYIRPITTVPNGYLLPVGDHRKLFDTEIEYSQNIKAVLDSVNFSTFNAVIVDCRGGFDTDSLAICNEVDKILIVVETDAASLQTTQHLVDILSKKDLIRKISGFVINKAFTRPSQLASLGSSLFRANFLGAIPFDFETTRRFIFGELPRLNGVFVTHVALAGQRAFPTLIQYVNGSSWSDRDFDRLSLRDPDSLLGGAIIGGVLLISAYLNLAYFLKGEGAYGLFSSDRAVGAFDIVILILGAFGSADPIRRTIGRTFRNFARLFSVITSRDRDTNTGKP
jgi:septum site-determining protein MinD